MKVCKIPKCGGKLHGKGYCWKHCNRLRKYGNPLGRSPNTHKITTWLKKHSFYEGDECLAWPFSLLPNGYGQSRDYFGVGKGAHRNMCYMAHGKPPTRKHEAAHSCKQNRACVNPNHLSWKTASENRKDKLKHGTHARGERNHKAKLTEIDVRYIRKMKDKITGSALAERFGVTPALISRIYHKKAWWWLE